MRIDRVAVSGSNCLLDFNSRTGRLYSIGSTTVFPQTNVWTEVANDIPGDGILMTVPVAVGDSQQFYRLKVRRNEKPEKRANDESQPAINTPPKAGSRHNNKQPERSHTMKPMKSKSLSLLAGALALLAAETLRGDVITLQPVDDAYLSNSSVEADQTWNSALLEQFGYYGGLKRPLLKFDLSSIPDGATILSAELTIALHGIYGGQGHSTTVWRMPNDNWNETNVTWNSYAQTGAVLVASLPGTDQLGARVWHIQLAGWPYATDLADDAVTFQARWDTDGNGGSEGDGYYKANSYSSKEGTVSPTLRIEYTADSASPPRLSITLNPQLSSINVSWPAPADGWMLERTNALSSVAVASWPQVSPPYQTNGDTISVTFTNTPAVGNQFFRLHKP